MRYKGPRADHIYSRITDPERAFVDVVGTLKAEADGSPRGLMVSLGGVGVGAL
jgi:hypothetical protein